MLYLSGSKHARHAAHYASGRLGLLRTPRNGYALDGVAAWAMDNGAYTGQYPGDDEYVALLATLEAHRARCLFVAVPDVVGDAAATLALWPAMSARIAALGWPVALVAQDGMTPDDLPPDLPWLFVGGSTAWKLGPDARALCAAARAQGTRIHCGRVNSERRFRYALHTLGASSCDGTFLAFAPDKGLSEVIAWGRLTGQGVLT